MKIAMAFTVLAVVLAASAAQGQHNLSPDGKEAIPYVKMAADIVGNVQQVALNHFLAVYVSFRDSEQAVKDDDLGPFMKIKQAEPQGGWSAVCFFSAKKDAAACVYFDEKKPFGVASVKAGSGGKLDDPSAAYQRVTVEMRKKNAQKLEYAETTVTTDYGAGLTGFAITAQ